MIDARPWYRWPEDRRRGVVPWWVILRRGCAYPIVAVGIGVFVVGVLLGWGRSEAARAMENIR